MIIGDTEERKKILVSGVVMDFHIDDMFVVIAWFQQKMLIIPPDIGCERREVSNVKKILNKFLDKNAYPDGKLPCIPPEYRVSQSNGKYATAEELFDATRSI